MFFQASATYLQGFPLSDMGVCPFLSFLFERNKKGKNSQHIAYRTVVSF
jgi:hypothetical protein